MYQILKSLANSEDPDEMQRGIPYGSTLFASWEKYNIIWQLSRDPSIYTMTSPK